MAQKKAHASGPRRRRNTGTTETVSPRQNRMFAFGEKVKVAKKSTVVDHDREHEGPPAGTLDPLECDVTGIEGEVTGPPYVSKDKGGEVCVPIQLPNEAVIAVPESRLERVRTTDDGMGSRVGHSRRYAEGWDRAFGKKTPKNQKRK